MKLLSAFLLSLLIPLAAPPSFAQEANQQEAKPEEAKPEREEEAKKARAELERKAFAFLERLIADSASFSLPENGIYVQAKAVEMLWKHDEARARELAREAMSQIAAFNAAMIQEEQTSLPQARVITSARPKWRICAVLC